MKDFDMIDEMFEQSRRAQQAAAEDLDLVFEDNQGKKHYLNAGLVRKQNVSPENIEQIKKLHIELDDIFATMKTITDRETLRNFVKDIEEIEFSLQDAWGFERNRDHHSHWMNAPGCLCPKMDNRDPAYFGRRIIVGNCPLHGSVVP